MEFSWNYINTMDAFSTRANCGEISTGFNDRQSLFYKAFLQYDFNPEGCEIPAYMFYLLNDKLLTIESPLTIVNPLYLDYRSKVCAGAETMLRFFSRQGPGRLYEASIKEETYYGNNGIILDNDFNPLLLIMLDVNRANVGNHLIKRKFIIHMSPKVFTEDTKTLNKSLARKALPFYLSHTPNSWNLTSIPYQVVIDDCSQFIKKPKVPIIDKCSAADMNAVLKDNIDEVLKQIVYDYNGRNY